MTTWEMVQKRVLLDKMAHEFGLEDRGTIKLHEMDENGESYKDMLNYYHKRWEEYYFNETLGF